MPGMPVIVWGDSLRTKAAAGLIFVLLLGIVLMAQQRVDSGGEKVLSIDAIVKALVAKHATIASVAQTIGDLAEKRSVEYRILADDTRVESVFVGIREGEGPSAVPKYVQIYFRTDHAVSLVKAVPSCTQWKAMPTNPGSNPFHYACSFDGSNGEIYVRLIADLTEDIDSPSAYLQGLLLQRNVR